MQVYCGEEGILVLAEIPGDRRIAEAYARGALMIDALPEYRAVFEVLWKQLETFSEQTG